MTATPTRLVPVGDFTMNVADVGDGAVLLLVHGFPLDHTMWTYQLEELAGRYRVLAPDLRGFGQSRGVVEGMSMAQLADDLAWLLDTLRITQPITFCGLSMGGYVAWQFWQRHRQRLGRLILCDTRARPDTPEAARGRKETAERVLREGPQTVAESLLPKLFAEQTMARQADFVEQTRQVMLGTPSTTIAAALRAMAERSDATGLLPSIDLPTLLLGGEHDVIAPPQEMRAIAAAMPQARFVEIPKAGHMAPLENPRATNAAILQFLS